MYYMVKYIDDGIVYVCLKKNVRSLNNGLCEAKYLDHRYYKAQILATCTSRRLLPNIARNMNSNTPRIIIDKNVGLRNGFSDDNEVENIEEPTSPFDDSDEDPDFVLSDSDPSTETLFEASEDSTGSTNKRNRNLLHNSTQKDLHKVINLTTSKDEVKIDSLGTQSTSLGNKQHFCPLCHKLVSKFARHLLTVHKEEHIVEKFKVLPKQCPERLRLIQNLRAEGDFIFNSSPEYNLGRQIVKKRPTKHLKSEYIPCSNCTQMYSKTTIRNHRKRCVENYSLLKGRRNVISESRKLHNDMHHKADAILKTQIFPYLRDDVVVNILKFDEGAIIYGNKLVKKYRSIHTYKMIRAKLRTLGRFLIYMNQRHSDITLVKCINPLYYDDVIECINRVGGFCMETKTYSAPSTAYNLGRELKWITLLIAAELIKQRASSQEKQQVQEFLHLLETGLNTDVNKTVLENQAEMKRNKKICLPSVDDIRVFRNFLAKNRYHYYNLLRRNFTFDSWKKLAEFTLISVQLFNRRRPGELERIALKDYDSREYLKDDTNSGIINSLSKEAKQFASQYSRCLIRGKLGKTVPVLFSAEIETCIALLVEYRQSANISKCNPYLFALPGEDRYRHIEACALMRKFSIECGASRPETLRGTELRKHIATHCINMDLEDASVRDIADFMGHREDIHRRVYRQSIVGREIDIVGKVLIDAQGGSDEVNIHEENEKEDYVDVAASSHNKSRRSWSTPEREVVDSTFATDIEEERIPDVSQCESLLKQTDILAGRKAPHIRAFVSNEIRRRKKNLLKQLSPNSPAQGSRKRWSAEEKQAVQDLFHEDISQRKYPKTKDIKKALGNKQFLKNRSPEMVKSYISNMFRKKHSCFAGGK